MTETLQEYITTKEAADMLGYTIQHTRFLIRDGSLPGLKFGRDWLIERQAVLSFYYPDDAGNSTNPTPTTTHLQAVNVSQVPQRSPFRYPGGKTWLVPCIRQWLSSFPTPISELIEPFAGGGIVSLTAIFEELAEHVTMVELDEDVASVWETILNGKALWLAEQIGAFEPTLDHLQQLFDTQKSTVEQQAFATLVRNRVARGGILAPGAGLVKRGENGKGLTSRWYPETIRRRILEIADHQEQITFVAGDGMKLLQQSAHRPEVAWFIDPPYTVAGKRLYRYSEIDHEKLFALASEVAGEVLITYDDAPEIRYLAMKNNLDIRLISMKTTHHTTKTELLIGKSLSWLPAE